MKQLWAPWRMAYVSGEVAPEAGGCFLCRTAQDGVDAQHVVERTARTFTLLNRYPYSSGHVMVVPARHAPDIVDLDDAEASAVMAAVQRAVRAIRAALNAEGFNVGLNSGGVAGASVEHVHVHVVPRWGGDTNFMPVIGDVKVLPEHLDATAATLREAFSSLPSG